MYVETMAAATATASFFKSTIVSRSTQTPLQAIAAYFRAQHGSAKVRESVRETAGSSNRMDCFMLELTTSFNRILNY